MAVILKRAKGLNTASNSLTNWTQGMFGYPRNVAPTHPSKLSTSEHRSKSLSSLENGKEPWNSMWVLVAFFSTVAKKVFMWPGNLRRGVRLGGYPCCRNWWKVPAIHCRDTWLPSELAWPQNRNLSAQGLETYDHTCTSGGHDEPEMQLCTWVSTREMWWWYS